MWRWRHIRFSVLAAPRTTSASAAAVPLTPPPADDFPCLFSRGSAAKERVFSLDKPGTEAYNEKLSEIYNNVIGIIVFHYFGEQFAGVTGSYNAYYFSVKDDKEITFEEYLSEIGLTNDVLQDRISKTDAYLNCGTEIDAINDCILDTFGTIACCEAVVSMDGWFELTTEPII